MKDVDVGIVTHASVTTGDNAPRLQFQMTGKKKVTFDIATKKDTFFDAKNEIKRNPSKLPIIDMPSTFDPSLETLPSRQHGTLRNLFESCLSLARDSDALVNLET